MTLASRTGVVVLKFGQTEGLIEIGPMMIRNVVMGRLRAAADDEQAAQDRQQLETAINGILGLELPGLIANQAGLDVGLRDGGWTFAITNDWEDADAYRNYDVDPEHNVHRQAIGAVCEQLARVQFEL